MERPKDPEKKVIGRRAMRPVARTMDLLEAERIAESFEMKGYKTEIVKKKQGNITLYEVWAEEKAEIFEQ